MDSVSDNLIPPGVLDNLERFEALLDDLESLSGRSHKATSELLQKLQDLGGGAGEVLAFADVAFSITQSLERYIFFLKAAHGSSWQEFLTVFDLIIDLCSRSERRCRELIIGLEVLDVAGEVRVDLLARAREATETCRSIADVMEQISKIIEGGRSPSSSYVAAPREEPARKGSSGPLDVPSIATAPSAPHLPAPRQGQGADPGRPSSTLTDGMGVLKGELNDIRRSAGGLEGKAEAIRIGLDGMREDWSRFLEEEDRFRRETRDRIANLRRDSLELQKQVHRLLVGGIFSTALLLLVILSSGTQP